MRVDDIDQIKEVKLVMLGSTTVGKTSIVTRLTKGFFNGESTSTIGTAFLSKTIPVDDIQVKIQIWDTGGSERYRAMAPMYFQNADAAIIVYDITSAESFADVETWLKELRDKGPENILICLAGNKSDLSQMRAITQENMCKYAQGHGIPIFKETSALTGENVESLFTEIARQLSKGVPNEPQMPKLELAEKNKTPTKEKTSCCN
ncbi:Ras-related protein Rab-5B [Histomonas meleagridis]|uniref:Ras-related protein Rab-5B n=1 Tax=Histomonas meleagridis TaxID=135588 RepID=UPI003559BCD6|nr:Ras-related protein Rab-5B [Histomonas meleagridis]KAH0802571.1 Ras-related protein Rab-5B [Histomonas meleagridis]